MIFEIFMGIICGGSILTIVEASHIKAKSPRIIGGWQPLLEGELGSPPGTPVLSDEVELITELLNQDDGWKFIGLGHFEHNHGVRVVMTGGGLGHPRTGVRPPKYALVSILDDKQIYQAVKLTGAETKHVTAKFKAFIARQEANKQRDLGKVLAARIVSGTTVGQLAGPEPAVDNVAGNEAVSTLHWDSVTQSIVATGRDGTKQLVPTKEFKKRYGLGDEAQSFRQLGFVSCERDGVTTWYNPKYVNELIPRPERPKCQSVRM